MTHMNFVYNNKIRQISSNVAVEYSPTHSKRRRKVRWAIAVSDLTAICGDWTAAGPF